MSDGTRVKATIHVAYSATAEALASALHLPPDARASFIEVFKPFHGCLPDFDIEAATRHLNGLHDLANTARLIGSAIEIADNRRDHSEVSV